MDRATQKSIFRHGIRNAVKHGLRKFMRTKQEMRDIYLERESNE
jgi:hypothetical protein